MDRTESDVQAEMDAFMEGMTRDYGGSHKFRMWGRRVNAIVVDDFCSVSVYFDGSGDRRGFIITQCINIREWMDGIFEWWNHS